MGCNGCIHFGYNHEIIGDLSQQISACKEVDIKLEGSHGQVPLHPASGCAQLQVCVCLAKFSIAKAREKARLPFSFRDSIWKFIKHEKVKLEIIKETKPARKQFIGLAQAFVQVDRHMMEAKGGGWKVAS